MPVLSKPWFFLFAGFVVPGYVIWSRGWRGVGWVLLHSVLWLVAVTVTYFFVYLLVFGPEWRPPEVEG